MGHKTRIMYIEDKGGDGIVGDARIGRVTFSKTGKTIYYGGDAFHSLGGQGFKSNYRNKTTGREYWISGCRKDGRDALYPNKIEIDPDIYEEYWRDIRGITDEKEIKSAKFFAKYGR